jgi:hypothetical protein
MTSEQGEKNEDASKESAKDPLALLDKPYDDLLPQLSSIRS